MSFPSKEKAHAILKSGESNTPGRWVDHSFHTAKCAYIIASHCEGMDVDKAYVLGLLHDIGRRYGITDCKHVIDGYNFMLEMDYPDVARICLTHSFPYQTIKCFSGKMDISENEYRFLDDYLSTVVYDDYDLLIQLCDALASSDGPCVIEQRLLDVAIRRGLKETSIEKWKKYLELKKYFDAKIGASIYSLFDIIL